MVSVMFWNVENFGRNFDSGEPDNPEFIERVNQVSAHIQSLNPDLLCLSEISDKVALRNLLMDTLSDYDFAVTDGSGNIELVTGWKRDKFQQVLFTQRRQFQVDNALLRPGALCSVKFEGKFFNFLFLHTDSGIEDRDYRNRQGMFGKIWRLKEVLDNISDGSARFVAMGDLNTMGREEARSLPIVSQGEEIANLAADANENGMQLLSKTHDVTWREGPADPTFASDLDHVLATSNISFQSFENSAEVSVDGWNRLEGEEQDNFTMNVSDHCSIFCRIRSEQSSDAPERL